MTHRPCVCTLVLSSVKNTSLLADQVSVAQLNQLLLHLQHQQLIWWLVLAIATCDLYPRWRRLGLEVTMVTFCCVCRRWGLEGLPCMITEAKKPMRDNMEW